MTAKPTKLPLTFIIMKTCKIFTSETLLGKQCQTSNTVNDLALNLLKFKSGERQEKPYEHCERQTDNFRLCHDGTRIFCVSVY